MDANELKTWITTLAKEKNFTEDETRIAVAAATGDATALQGVAPETLAKVTAPLLTLTVGRQSDYSKALDEAKAEKQKAAAHFQKLEVWRTQTVLPEVEKLRERVGKFESKYGRLEDVEDISGGRSVTASGDEVETVDVDELRKSFQQQQAQDFLAYELERDQLSQEFFSLFKAPLPLTPLIDKIRESATDALNPRTLTLREAFNAVHGAKIKELADQARAEEIKAAEARGKEQGRREAFAANSPRTGAAVPPGTGNFWDAINRDQKTSDADKLSEADRMSAFNQDYRTEFERSEAETEAQINR